MLQLSGDRNTGNHTTLIYNKGKQDNWERGTFDFPLLHSVFVLNDFRFLMPNKMAVLGM